MARSGDKNTAFARFCSVKLPLVVFATVTLVTGAVTTSSTITSVAVVLGGVVTD